MDNDSASNYGQTGNFSTQTEETQASVRTVLAISPRMLSAHTQAALGQSVQGTLQGALAQLAQMLSEEQLRALLAIKVTPGQGAYDAMGTGQSTGSGCVTAVLAMPTKDTISDACSINSVRVILVRMKA